MTTTTTTNGLTILSMGLGRDSVTMLCLAAEGRLVVDSRAPLERHLTRTRRMP